MKNLTRVLALVLVFSMILGTVAFAAFTDVKDTDDYAEAIETLAGLGIIKGYEDGTFGADKAITRAEAVAIVNRIQNLSAAADGAAGASLYTDVAANHWAIGDINLATQMGTVSGDGNGMFRPEDQVSYQEMVKMLVVALGYQPAATDKGGWPTGYLVVASQYGVLDDTVNGGAAPATRGVVAQLTFNALTAPMMEQTGYGDDKSYEVKDVAGARKTLLTEKLSIYKVDVTPVATDVTSIDGSAKADVGKVRVNIEMNQKTTRSDSDAFYGVKLPFSLATGEDDKTVETFVAGDSTIGDNLAYSTVAYIKKNADKDWEVLFATVEAGKTRTFDIDPSNVDSVDTAKKQIRIKDDDIKLDDKYDYDTNTVVIKNNEVVGKLGTTGLASEDDIKALFKYDNGSSIEGYVTFLMNGKNDDVVDYIFVDSYVTDRVSDESPSGKTIILEQGGVINLDTKDNKKLVYTLTMDGKDVTPADLKENDIVTYRKTASSKDFYDIIVTRATVEGTVDSTYVDDGVTYYEIGGKDYKPSKSAYASGNTNDVKYDGSGNLILNNVKVGSAGTFYLDAFGKVAYFEKGSHASADSNYAYVISTGKTNNSSMDPKYGIELMTADGKTATYDFASKVTVTKNSRVDDETATDDDGTQYTVIKSDKTVDATFKAAVDGTVGQLVDYTKNSSGEISEITIWTGAKVKNGDSSYFTFNYEGTTLDTYNDRNSKIGGYVITKDTVVFYVGDSTVDKDDYEVSDISFFEDDDTYKIAVYGAEDGDDGIEAGAVIVKNKVATGSEKENVAVFVRQATVKNESGTRVASIEFFQDGESKTMLADSANVGNNLKAGDIFYYTKNSKGELTGVTKPAMGDYEYPEDTGSNEIKYVFGQVYDRSGSTVKLGGFASDDYDSHKIPDGVAAYLVDYSGSKVKVSLGDIKSVTKNRYTKADELYDEDDADNYLVALKYKGDDIIGVVIYMNAIDVDATNTAGHLVWKNK